MRGVADVLNYHAYVLDKTGHVIKRHEFESSSDEAALKYARRYVDGRDVEVRQRERMVALLRSEKRGV
jgi:hypothetical protein